LEANEVVLGTFIQDVRSPFVVQLAAAAGLDFIIIDTEHGAFNTETVADLIKLARAAGVIPIVRVIAGAYEHICPRLDAGAGGVLVPRVSSAEAVRQAVRVSKYPPAGIRGIITLKGQTDYVIPDLRKVVQEKNAQNFIIPQIELREALDRLDEIVSVEGIDAVLVGPCDLSVSLGRPGELTRPEQTKAIERVIESCRRHGVAPGIAVGGIAPAKEWIARGMRLVCCQTDVMILATAFNQITKELRAVKPKA
jgi:2-dehydro-3-deoxyglucarate aldolase/4-hydroxy-2-oxoheptanedioate aldolase